MLYQPLSVAAKQADIQLTQEEMRLAVKQRMTGSKREQHKRESLQVWRLGFDRLQRDISGNDNYLPVPSLSKQLLKGDFPSFCHHLADLKGITLHKSIDYASYQAKGTVQFEQIKRLELVRMLFRRPLEIWLNLDSLLYQTEQGYDCSLQQFCPPQITPRNLLLEAVLP